MCQFWSFDSLFWQKGGKNCPFHSFFWQILKKTQKNTFDGFLKQVFLFFLGGFFWRFFLAISWWLPWKYWWSGTLHINFFWQDSTNAILKTAFQIQPKIFFFYNLKKIKSFFFWRLHGSISRKRKGKRFIFSASASTSASTQKGTSQRFCFHFHFHMTGHSSFGSSLVTR